MQGGRSALALARQYNHVECARVLEDCQRRTVVLMLIVISRRDRSLWLPNELWAWLAEEFLGEKDVR